MKRNTEKDTLEALSGYIKYLMQFLTNMTIYTDLHGFAARGAELESGQFEFVI